MKFDTLITPVGLLRTMEDESGIWYNGSDLLKAIDAHSQIWHFLPRHAKQGKIELKSFKYHSGKQLTRPAYSVDHEALFSLLERLVRGYPSGRDYPRAEILLNWFKENEKDS